MQTESSQLEKTMQNRHLSVGQFSEPPSFLTNTSSTTAITGTTTTIFSDSQQFEGYLFKRTSKGFKTWNRRWFMLHNNKLLYVYVLTIYEYIYYIDETRLNVFSESVMEKMKCQQLWKKIFAFVRLGQSMIRTEDFVLK